MTTYSLRRFLSDTERVVRGSSTESEVLRGVRPLMKNLLAVPNAFPSEAFATRKDRFANNLVYMPKDKVFSVNAGVWQPGQTTPIHDHLTWAVVGVYQGKEHESLYKRTDDRSNPKIARIEKMSDRTNEKGHVTVLGSAGIHRIDNASDKPSQSIHVYGLDIGNTERHTYDPVTGKIGKFVSGYCNVLRDLDEF